MICYICVCFFFVFLFVLALMFFFLVVLYRLVVKMFLKVVSKGV